MEPKDLENSIEELKATPKKEEATTMPDEEPKSDVKKVENVSEEKTEAKMSEKVEEKAEEKAEASEKAEEKEGTSVKAESIEAENKNESVKEEKKKIDYSECTEPELINVLRQLVSENKDIDIKDEVERIKSWFYKKHKVHVKEEKEAFLKDGGKEEDFVSVNIVYEKEMKQLLKDFHQIREVLVKSEEQTKEKNLETKYKVIEGIKSLVNRKESINKTFQEFRELQQQWKEIGMVPQSDLKGLWETYHHHVENFYDYIKINKELRDMDLKKNYAAKINLCEKAEELLNETSVIKAFNILQKYHEQWREIGPVVREKKEELWNRFKLATSKINKLHQQYFENKKEEQKKNLEKKTSLCEKAEEFMTKEMKGFSDWDKTSKSLIDLQTVWKTVGLVPKKDNASIYERFRAACDNFFNAKREFYTQNKEEQQQNLNIKNDLCEKAEELKNSTEWSNTTRALIEIQKKWKETGPVPRKHSDIIWKRFRTACDYFFEEKSKHFSGQDKEQKENLALKKQLIEEVKQYKITKDQSIDIAKLKDFQKRWSDIGFVPFKEKDAIFEEFRSAINVQFDHLKLGAQERDLMRFQSKVTGMSSSGSQSKMHFERSRYSVKIKQMENDLALLKNNIGFFANTKNAESLIENVNRNIDDTQKKIDVLKEKIRIIDNMEDEY
ncbi:MAG: DUF349 domain-containing protein [Prolixibacteraceae bacterium]|nr:DUF349 domain-containing protein [Prolixibacteraceae bacterium]